MKNFSMILALAFCLFTQSANSQENPAVDRSWDTVSTFSGYAQVGSQLALSPNGTTLSQIFPEIVILYDTKTGKELMRAKGTDFRGYVRYSPDAKYALWQFAKTITIWDMAKNRLHKELDVQHTSWSTFLPDNKAVLVWLPESFDQRKPTRMILWNFKTGEKEQEWEKTSPAMDNGLLTTRETLSSSDGRFLVLRNAVDGNYLIWDRQAKKEIINADFRSYTFFGIVDNKTFGLKRLKPDRTLPLAATVEYLDLPAGTSKAFPLNKSHIPAPDSAAQALRISPDGRMFATTDFNMNVVIWDFVQQKVASDFTLSSSLPPQSSSPWFGSVVFWNRDSNTLVVAYGPTLYVHDIRSGLFAYLKSPTTINDYAFSADGLHLAAIDMKGNITVWKQRDDLKGKYAFQKADASLHQPRDVAKEAKLPTVKELKSKETLEGVKALLGQPTEIQPNLLDKKGFLYIWNKDKNGYIAIYFVDGGGILVTGGILAHGVDRKQIDQWKRFMKGEGPSPLP